MANENFIENSKKQYRSSGVPTLEEINTGCLQRIALATELMSKNYNDLIYWKKYYQDLAEKRSAEINRLTDSIRSYRGTITKLKNKLSEKTKTA